ncbi:MAG: cupin domain-containing protein [Alphaproteobacteria bacterium]|nr:cupin domain-containing protein [Alphaproteobacteria bacterium]
MSKAIGNIFGGIPEQLPEELFTTLVDVPNVRVERIVSRGHASPPGFWYDQPQAEWVLVLSGSAAVLFEGEASPHVLRRGDHLHIPAHAKHRVEWTDATEPTVWLAVHYKE